MSKKNSVASKRRRQRNRRLMQRGLLSFNRFEDRRLLATFAVTSNADIGAGTLRDAITIANITPGADEIVFASNVTGAINTCLLYTSPSPRDLSTSRMPSSA